MREALPVERQPRKPAILVDCSIPLREDLRAAKPASKAAPLPERRRATAQPAVERKPAAQPKPAPAPQPAKRPAAAAAPKQPSPGGFATPIPTDLGAFFPRPKRGRSAEQKPLVPRTEF